MPWISDTWMILIKHALHLPVLQFFAIALIFESGVKFGCQGFSSQ